MQCFYADYACIAVAFLFPTFGKRASGQETGSINKRAATEPSPGTVTSTESHYAAAESDAATEHVAAGAETIMSMQAIVTEFSASSTDDARDLVNAAQVMLTGERQDVRNLCKPWGVHLTAQKNIAP